MAAYQAQGVDLCLDLEHLSLGDLGRADASDARGWFKLELRNGELWAVDCKWTPDGARRLSEKTQRYTSPAFLADENGRVCELINVALVAMPATHQAAPLVAAAKRGGPFTRSGSTTVRARVVKADADRFRALAKSLDQTPGETLRVLIALAVKDPTKTFSAVAKLLELPADALPSEILDALEALVADAAAEGAVVSPGSRGDALTDAAAPPPAKLNKAEQEYCTKHQLTAAQFTERKAKAVRVGDAPAAPAAPAKRVGLSNADVSGLTDAERAYMKKHQLTREQFLARKASAVKVAK